MNRKSLLFMSLSFLCLLKVVGLRLPTASGAWTVGGDSYAYRMSVTVQDTYIDANLTGPVLHVPFINHFIGSKMSTVDDFRFANDANAVMDYTTIKSSLSGGSLNAVYEVQVQGDVNATGGEAFWFYADTASPSDGTSDANVYDTNEVLAWHLEADANDSSAGGNNGTFVGDASLIDGGYASRGATFDGDGDSISVPLNLSTLDEFTISMWVAQDDWLGSGLKAFLANYGVAYNGSASLYHRPITPTSSQIAFALVDTTGSGKTARSVRGVSSSLQGWNHIVAIYSSEQTVSGSNYMELYINGSTSGNTYTDANAVWTPDATRGTILFGDSYTESLPFSGQMDEIKVWDRVLDANEVKFLYHNWAEDDHEITYGDVEPAGTPTPGVIVVPVVDANTAPESDVIQVAGSSPIEGISGELTIDLGAALLILTFSNARLRLEPKE